jgi:hypothetical protein
MHVALPINYTANQNFTSHKIDETDSDHHDGSAILHLSRDPPRKDQGNDLKHTTWNIKQHRLELVESHLGDDNAIPKNLVYCMKPQAESTGSPRKVRCHTIRNLGCNTRAEEQISLGIQESLFNLIHLESLILNPSSIFRDTFYSDFFLALCKETGGDRRIREHEEDVKTPEGSEST